MDEYSSGGGKLKLKGSKVSDGKIKKKKSSKKSSSATTGPTAAPGPEGADAEKSKEGETGDVSMREPGEDSVAGKEEGEGEEGSSSATATPMHAKTEAEKRHDETRRKRVQERVKRGGAKTHKERVEGLNKYLSRLSEHHDMPKIGPG